MFFSTIDVSYLLHELRGNVSVLASTQLKIKWPLKKDNLYFTGSQQLSDLSTRKFPPTPCLCQPQVWWPTRLQNPKKVPISAQSTSSLQFSQRRTFTSFANVPRGGQRPNYCLWWRWDCWLGLRCFR